VFDLDQLNAAAAPTLTGHVGATFTHAEHGLVRARLDVQPHLLAANGFLHAATVVALADSCCGFGTVVSLPDDQAAAWTTVELKANFTGTAREGAIECEARLVHGGKSTQVWDATVTAGTRVIALFRCTQLILRT
jgi:uncharacterized protein (TIGR00369 family)